MTYNRNGIQPFSQRKKLGMLTTTHCAIQERGQVVQASCLNHFQHRHQPIRKYCSFMQLPNNVRQPKSSCHTRHQPQSPSNIYVKYPNKSYENHQFFWHWNDQTKSNQQNHLSKIIFEMKIVIKQLKAILHTKSYLPWETP